MCNFFSFISNGQGSIFYFNAEQRRNLKGIEFDSHSQIAKHFLKSTNPCDNCNKFEYINEDFIIDQINTKDDSEKAKKWINKFKESVEFQEICLEAVKQDGRALRYVENRFKKFFKKE